MHMPSTEQAPQPKALQLMTLNIWGGKLLEPLLRFIDSHRAIDIFCLQEVYSQTHQHLALDPNNPLCLDLFERIAELLPNHRAFFRPIVEGVYGLSTFIQKDYPVLAEESHWIYENKHYSGHGPSHSRIMQWIKISLDWQDLSIINVHGLWDSKGKMDTPQRILQSHTIKNFAESLNTPTILCGDFNLSPGTKSVEILANKMRNLIKVYHVTSTRSDIYKKPERFADYIFMSEDLQVLDFKVFEDSVSDHLPLYVKFAQ